MNYFFAKFLEILTTGLLEISKFVQKQSVLVAMGSFDLQKSENCLVLCIVTFFNISLS